MAVKISSFWKVCIALLPMLGSAQSNWFPAVRLSRPATAQGVFETVAQDLRNGLVFWVPAATSQTSAAWDYSSNAVPLDLTNAVGLAPAWVTNGGGAWAFGATQFWASVSAVPTSLSTQGTYAAWLCITQGAGNVQFVLNSSENSGAGKHAWTLRISGSNTASFVTGNNSGNDVPDTSYQFSTNAWDHFAVTFSNGNYNIYTKGVLRRSGSNTQWGSIGWTNVLVGDSGRVGAQRPFRGFIDNPQVWTRALTSNEIATMVFGPTNFGQRRAHGL